MYRAFYHLHTDPFRPGFAPALCFRHEPYTRALACVQDAVMRGEGFVILTGPAGTGKTTLIEEFHSAFDGTGTLVARLTGTGLQAGELLRLICLSLGITIPAPDKASILQQLREFCGRRAKAGRRTLLLIGDAQELPVQALEELRLLESLQLDARPLLQIVLVGQPQLLDMLRLPTLRPMLQDEIVTCSMEPLGPDETRTYIVDHLSRAGWSGDPVFDECSYRMIHYFSDGLVRQINAVCERLLRYGSSEKKYSLNCFDTFNVVRRLLEERPGATPESSFQASVEILNASWGTAGSGTAVAAAVDQSIPPAGQDQVPSSDRPGAAQPPSEIRPEPAAHDRYRGLATAQAVSAQQGRSSPAPGAGQRNGAAADTGRVAAKPQPGGENGSATGVGPQSAVPDSIAPPEAAPSRPPSAARQSVTTPERSHKRSAVRAVAVFGLFAALLGAVLLVSRQQTGNRTADLAGPAVAPDATDRSVAVPRLAPQSSPTLPGSAAIAPSGSDANREAAEPVEGPAAAQATGPAEPAIPATVLSAEPGATAPPVPDERALNPPRADSPTPPQSGEDSPGDSASAPQPVPADALAVGDGGVPVASPATDVIARPASQSLAPDAPAEVVAEPMVGPAGTEQQRIDRLMSRAEQALAENRLTTPQDDSAYRYYRQVLEIEPQHSGARVGMQRIVERYISLTQAALAADRIGAARSYVGRGLSVSPGDRELLELQDAVQVRQLWLDVGAEEEDAARAPRAK